MKKATTSVATLEVLEPQIIHFKVHDHADFGLDEMLEVRELNAKLSEGNPYCVLMEAGEFSSFSKEAKNASASEEHTKDRLALAIIQNSLAMKMVARFYMVFNKPVGKTKVFSSPNDAMQWLRKIKAEYYANEKEKAE